MKKIVFVLGTRPEAIKLYPLIEEFKKNAEFNTIVVSTGQQKELLESTLTSLGMNPDHSLNLMKENQSLTSITVDLFQSLEHLFRQLNPDVIFIHGDTTTSMASGIVAKYNKIQVVHVEAGLRSFDIMSPWPEEINRRINTVSSDYHLAPTRSSSNNLLNEGVDINNIYVTGNTGIDTLRITLPKLSSEVYLNRLTSTLKLLKDRFDSMILVTVHRRENFERLSSIFLALKEIAIKNKDFILVFPVHLNPNVHKKAREELLGIENILLVEPLPYDLFMGLLKYCYFIVTDSGGIQEEAAYLGKPVVLCRNTTERPEGIESLNIILTGTDSSNIVNTCEKLIFDKSYYRLYSKPSQVFGDGYSSKRIIEWFINKVNTNQGEEIV